MDSDNTTAAPAATSGTSRLYLTVAQVAERFGVSTDTVWRWSRNGNLPKPVKLGAGSTRWRQSDLDKYEGQLETGFIDFLSFPVSFSVE